MTLRRVRTDDSEDPMKHAGAILLLSAATAAPLTAQHSDAFRRTLRYAGDDIVLEVVGDGPGTLRLVRAGSFLDIAGHAPRALLNVAAPPAPGAPIRLISAGGGETTWIVTVPVDVRVQVRTPDAAHVQSVAAGDRIWTWRGPDERGRLRRTRRHHVAARSPDPAFTYIDAAAPETIRIDDLSGLRRLVVRYEGTSLGIAGSSPGLTVHRAGPGRVEIATARAGEADLLIVLPAAASGTRVLSGDRILVDIDGTTTCSPVTVLSLDTGTRVLSFTPVNGALQCRE